MPFRFSEMAYPPHSPLANAFAIRFSEMVKPVANAKHSPFANSLQRIGKHTAFAFGECKVNVYNFAPKLHKKACRLLNYEI
jgi:hypothetical protein